MSRIECRDEAAAVLRELTESLGIGEPEFIADDGERAFVTFVGTGQGHEVGLFAVLTRSSEGTYSAVNLYARPWPFVKLVRDHLAVSDERFRDDVDLSVPGHTWQLAGVFVLDDAGKIADMRIYSRPWPVTAFFRGEAYKLLRDQFGPEYWQGENPLVALGEV